MRIRYVGDRVRSVLTNMTQCAELNKQYKMNFQVLVMRGTSSEECPSHAGKRACRVTTAIGESFRSVRLTRRAK
jgi:hypothetical protein